MDNYCLATIVFRRSDLRESSLEHFLEDNHSNLGLLFHVFLHKLDQELVDEHFKAAWNLVHVFRLHELNYLSERSRSDDLVFSLRIESDELAKDRYHELVDGD